jgi:hypothetical protein
MSDPMRKSISKKGKVSVQANHYGLEDRRHFLKTFASTAAGAIVAPSLLTSASDHSPLLQKRYPDPAIVIVDKRFEKYFQFNAAVEQLWTGARWAEGPDGLRRQVK